MAERAEHRDVSLAAVPDNFVREVADELHGDFHQVLEFARIFHRKLPPQNEYTRDDQQDDEDLHRDVIRNGMRGVVRRNSHRS